MTPNVHPTLEAAGTLALGMEEKKTKTQRTSRQVLPERSWKCFKESPSLAETLTVNGADHAPLEIIQV